MNFNTLLHLIILGLLTSGYILKPKDLSKSVKNFIQHQNKPTKINLLLNCWTTNAVKLFSKSFIANYITRKIIPFKNSSLGVEIIKEENNQELFILDFDCYQSKENFFEELAENWVKYPCRWFVFIDNISTFPKELLLPLNTRIYLQQKTFPYILTSPYIIKNYSEYHYNHIGTWNSNLKKYENGLSEISDYKDRRNLRKLILNSTAVIVFQRSLEHLEDYRFLIEDSVSKHDYQILIVLQDVLNATIVIKWVSDWGSQNPNTSKYNYMWGDLQSNTADIGGSSGFITSDRLHFSDYVGNPLTTTTKFIFRAPPLSAVNNLLIMPFDNYVWMALALWSVLILILLMIIVKAEWAVMKFEGSTENALRPHYLEVIQLHIGVICVQGIEAEPRSISGKMVTFLALISGLFFYVSYSGAIVALLQSRSNSIDNVEDLLTTDIKLGLDDMPYALAFFKRQKGDVADAVLNKILPPNKPRNIFSAAIGVERLRTEFFAFHCERDTVYKHISKTFHEHEKCGLEEIKYLSVGNPYIAIRKHLPYKDIITMALSRFKEHGITKRFHKRIYTEKPKCTNSGGSFTTVNINDIYFAVIVYVIGASVSLVIYIAESVVNLYKKKSNKITVLLQH